MQAGDILLFRSEKELASKIIAWGTNSLYAHVAICISPELDIAIEAMTRGGVRARAISKISEIYDVYRVKSNYGYSISKLTAFLVKKLNNNYDWPGVIFLGLVKLISKIFSDFKVKANIFQKDKDYFCSELCYEAFFFAGLDIVPQISSSQVTSPGDIANSKLVEKVI